MDYLTADEKAQIASCDETIANMRREIREASHRRRVLLMRDYQRKFRANQA